MIGNFYYVFCASLKVSLAIFSIVHICWNDTFKRNISLKRSTFCGETCILHFTENRVCVN